MTKRYAIIAFCVVALTLYFGLHSAVIGANQGGTAHGQQGANIAMAEGFVDNGLNFSLPQTRALNYKNGDYSVNKTNALGVTAAHFPIHAYIPAVVHSITDWKLTKVIQWYNILWGFVGVFFVYLLSLRITNHIGKSLFVVVFIGTAPVFAFYQSNFLPEIPSVALILIGTYFIYRWRDENLEGDAWTGMSFFLLACASSPDLILYLLGGFVLVFPHLNVPRQKRKYAHPIVVAIAFSIVLIVSNLKFESLRTKNGSQFAGFLQDWAYDQSVHNSLFSSWKMHYFTVFQTVVLSLILIAVVTFFIRGRQWKTFKLKQYRIAWIFAFPLGFAVINPYQSVYSDVFFLKFLLIPATFVLIIIVDQFKLDFIKKYPKLSGFGFILLLFILLSEGNWTQNVRHELNRTSQGSNLAFAFRGGDDLLKKHGVKASDPLHVVVPNNWGIGQEVLGHLNHKGIIRETPNGEELLPGFPKGHYVVSHIDEKPHLHEYFKTNFVELGDNGNIVLFKVID